MVFGIEKKIRSYCCGKQGEYRKTVGSECCFPCGFLRECNNKVSDNDCLNEIDNEEFIKDMRRSLSETYKVKE